jgi:hypothetical protein
LLSVTHHEEARKTASESVESANPAGRQVNLPVGAKKLVERLRERFAQGDSESAPELSVATEPESHLSGQTADLSLHTAGPGGSAVMTSNSYNDQSTTGEYSLSISQRYYTLTDLQ